MMKKALLFRGGWPGHDPVETSDLIAEKLALHGVQCDIFNDQDCLLQPDLAEKYDLIIPVWTMGSLANEASQALCQAVAAGTGLGGWHGGMCDAFRENTDYQFMTGGQWVAHPGGIRDYTVQIVAEDPIVEGIPRELKVHSEQYYLHVDPGNEVLATTTFDGQILPWLDGVVMPVVWKRRYGQGRVFYCSLGHVIGDFERTPEITEILVRGLLWAAR